MRYTTPARNRGRRGGAQIAAVLAASLLLGSPAVGDSANLQDLVRALDSAAFGERERAQEALAEHADKIETLLCEGVIDPLALSHEQRARLASLLEARFHATARAGLGVQFAVANDPGAGVVLQRILPEFPASRTLQPGDVVIGADAIAFEGIAMAQAMDVLRAIIVSYDPGDSFPMVVRRGNVEHELQVELGDYRRLQNGAGPQEIDMTRGWLIRQTRIGLRPAPGTAYQPGLTRREWPTRPRHAGIAPGASIVSGGRSYAFNMGVLGPHVMSQPRNREDALRNQFRVVQEPVVLPVLPEDRAMPVQERLRRQIDLFSIQLRIAEGRAADLNASEAQRRDAAVQAMQLEARIAELRKELERLGGR